MQVEITTAMMITLIAVGVAIFIVSGRCLWKPSQGFLICIFTLPIYWSPEAVSAPLASLFGGTTQIPIAADVFIAVTAVGMILQRRRRARSLAVTMGLLLFVIAAAISIVNSTDALRSLSGLIAYAQLILLVFVVEKGLNTPAQVLKAVRVWMYAYFGVVAVGTVGMAAGYAGLDNFALFNAEQVRSTFHFPNQFSLFMVISVSIFAPLFQSRFLTRRVRMLLKLSLPLSAVVLIGSGSRSGLVGAMVAATLLLALERKRTAVVPAVLGLVMVALFLIPSGGNSVSDKIRARFTVLEQLATGQETSDLDFYADTNAVGWDAVRANPIVGGGIGAVLDTNLSDAQAYEIHNTYLGTLAQTGLLGATVALSIIFMVVKNLWEVRSIADTAVARGLANGCLAALGGAAVHAAANFDFRIRHFWLLLAFSTGVRVLADKRRELLFAEPRDPALHEQSLEQAVVEG